MNAVYHMPYTRMRTIDLVLADICSNPVGTLIEDAVRSIAARIGRSAGGITPALKRLAADGWISYLSDGRGSLIEVLRVDQESDRSVLSEAPIEEAPTALICDDPQVDADQEPDRSTSDQAPDRSACMVDHESKTQKEELARDPLFERLVQQPKMRPSLAKRIASNPLGTLADFLHDVHLAESTPGIHTPFWFTVACWRDGQRVEAPEEAQYAPQPTPITSRSEHHTRRNAQRGRRTERPGARGRSAPSSSVDPAVYAKILAEAVPLDCDDL